MPLTTPIHTTGRAKTEIVALIGWLILCFTVAGIGATASIEAPAFYASLQKPSWAPSASVFGPVWTVLYAMMGVAAWLVWRERRMHRNRVPTAIAWFLIQLALNAAWSWVFFVWHQGELAVLDIALLWIALAITVNTFLRIRVAAGLLLLPYLAWVTFATALTIAVWHHNPELL